jgi:hypothetical protein
MSTKYIVMLYCSLLLHFYLLSISSTVLRKNVQLIDSNWMIKIMQLYLNMFLRINLYSPFDCE